LLDKTEKRDEYLQFIKDEYEEIRGDYFDSLSDRKYLSLTEARKRKLQINWNDYTPRRANLKCLNSNL
jgi:5-methyltetrahydrofolate--homocysteine methyltransferase